LAWKPPDFSDGAPPLSYVLIPFFSASQDDGGKDAPSLISFVINAAVDEFERQWLVLKMFTMVQIRSGTRRPRSLMIGHRTKQPTRRRCRLDKPNSGAALLTVRQGRASGHENWTGYDE
jgi:hypothetical protein